MKITVEEFNDGKLLVVGKDESISSLEICTVSVSIKDGVKVQSSTTLVSDINSSKKIVDVFRKVIKKADRIYDRMVEEELWNAGDSQAEWE